MCEGQEVIASLHFGGNASRSECDLGEVVRWEAVEVAATKAL